MNIARLNIALNEKTIIGVGGGNEPKGGMKYYDCLVEYFRGEAHESYIVDTAKKFNPDSGEVGIGPEAAWVEFGWPLVAVGVDITNANKRLYKNGEWLDFKTFLLETDGFNPDTHVEITEEEYYHIPEDTEISLLPKDGEEVRKALFDKLLMLAERYEVALASGQSIPLMFWYKSLSVIVVSGNAHPAPMPIIAITDLVRDGEDIALVTDTIAFVTEGGKLKLYYLNGGPID